MTVIELRGGPLDGQSMSIDSHKPPRQVLRKHLHNDHEHTAVYDREVGGIFTYSGSACDEGCRL